MNPIPERQKEFIIRFEPSETADARLPEALAFLVRLAESRSEKAVS